HRADFLELRVRRVVVEQLGVGWDELRPEVSLVDDLAADSLDLVELSIGLEDELGLAVPESLLDDVRTFGELVEHLGDLEPLRDGTQTDGDLDEVPVSVDIVPARTRAAGRLRHAGPLTPYLAETIAEDALRGGPGTRLEVHVPRDVSETAV